MEYFYLSNLVNGFMPDYWFVRQMNYALGYIDDTRREAQAATMLEF